MPAATLSRQAQGSDFTCRAGPASGLWPAAPHLRPARAAKLLGYMLRDIRGGLMRWPALSLCAASQRCTQRPAAGTSTTWLIKWCRSAFALQAALCTEVASAQCSQSSRAEAHVQCGNDCCTPVPARHASAAEAGAACRGLQVSGVRRPEVLLACVCAWWQLRLWGHETYSMHPAGCARAATLRSPADAQAGGEQARSPGRA